MGAHHPPTLSALDEIGARFDAAGLTPNRATSGENLIDLLGMESIAREAIFVLQKIEWSPGARRCPLCDGRRRHGHEGFCRLGAVLARWKGLYERSTGGVSNVAQGADVSTAAGGAGNTVSDQTSDDTGGTKGGAPGRVRVGQSDLDRGNEPDPRKSLGSNEGAQHGEESIKGGDEPRGEARRADVTREADQGGEAAKGRSQQRRRQARPAAR